MSWNETGRGGQNPDWKGSWRLTQQVWNLSFKLSLFKLQFESNWWVIKAAWGVVTSIKKIRQKTIQNISIPLMSKKSTGSVIQVSLCTCLYRFACVLETATHGTLGIWIRGDMTSAFSSLYLLSSKHFFQAPFPSFRIPLRAGGRSESSLEPPERRTGTQLSAFVVSCVTLSSFFFKKKKLFIYLVLSILNCGTQDLCCVMWDLSWYHTNSLVEVCGLSHSSACEISVPRPGIKPTSLTLVPLDC